MKTHQSFLRILHLYFVLKYKCHHNWAIIWNIFGKSIQKESYLLVEGPIILSKSADKADIYNA